MRMSQSRLIPTMVHFGRMLMITRAWIYGFTGRLRGKPLLDMVGGVVEDYAYLWDEYYFSTATM